MNDTTATTAEADDQFPHWARPNVRAVDSWAIGAVLVKIEKVNAKAAKLGVPAFTYEVSEPRLVQVPQDDPLGIRPPKYKEVVDITIHGEPVQVSGYRFLGRVDFEDGMTLVNARPGEEIPVRYRSATTMCDHCAVNRQRACIFVFRRDGGEQHIQVGRSCLKDFMGHDPAAVLWSTSLWATLRDGIDEECERGGRPQHLARVEDVLAMAAAVVRHHGRFVSRAQANDSEGRMVATSSLVFGQMNPPSPLPKDWVTITPTEDDVARAAEMQAWALETMVKPEQSDYEYNLTSLLQQETVQVKRLGMLVSLAGVYARHLGELVARAKRVNAHVGVVGKRQEFTATFAGQSTYDNAYGTVFIGRFDADAGLLVYKGSSPFWAADSKPGDEFKFVATVKDHADYKGTKQTLIQRVKVIEEAVAA